ncbi:putative secreted protein [Lachnospiraceae bacterium KM106-2]|nr:putative secreted protein [Lachnospiraceae bacterium KM106-2]
MLIKRRYSGKTIASFGTSMIALVLIGAVFFGSGFSDTYQETYQRFQNRTDKISNTFRDSLKDGSYKVASIEYGTKRKGDLSSHTVSLASYIGEYKGIKKQVRDLYYGYNIDHVNLKGKVWYPLHKEKCPVLFIVHGNHDMTVDSYLGYEYLGKHLASRGYVVVSVDENYCNSYIDTGFSREVDARAVLLLANMKQIERYNYNKTTVLYHKIDFNQIALAGHSRGGEAVVAATEYNRLGRNPDDADLTYNDHFKIKTVIAIAPTSDQYMPSGKDMYLHNVNYLLIQGANDHDVTTFQGRKQYEHIVLGPDNVKSSVYLAGANHSQFNTKWGSYDVEPPFSFLLNTKNQISAREQRKLLVGYCTAFLDGTITGNRERMDLFQESMIKQKDMPSTISITGYEDSSFVPIADYEEDYDLASLSLNEATATTSNLYLLSEDPVYESDLQDKTWNTALHIKWEKHYEGYYAISLSDITEQDKRIISNKNQLQFDVMDLFDKRSNHRKKAACNFAITIVDRSGRQASLDFKDSTILYPPLPIRLYKLQFITGSQEYKHQFQTVQIPLSRFKKKNQALNTKEVKEIRFDFDREAAGEIMIDHVGLAK